jgi:DNA-binding NarL/FixJ family response regulator
MRILIVDDHPIMRGGVRVCLHDFDPTIDVVEAATLQDGMRIAKQPAPIDVVLLDLYMPGFTGIAALVTFRESIDPCPPVVVFSSSDDAATAVAALDAGAMGYIPKSSTPQVLQSALRLVLANGVYVPPTVLGFGAAARAPVAAAPQSGRPLRKLAELGLTPRQQEVCALMVKGQAVKQIARKLNISPATVKVHLQPILRSLEVENRTEAIVALHRMGFSLEVAPEESL